MYKINYEDINNQLRLLKIRVLIGVILSITAFNFYKLIEEDLTFIMWLGFCILFAILLFGTGISGIVKLNKRKKDLKRLEKDGVLIKNLPYKFVDPGIDLELGNKVYAIEVEYVNPEGEKRIYTSYPKFNDKKYVLDGKMDLLIDTENEDNYYIDYNIVEKSKDNVKINNEIKYNIDLFSSIKLKYFDRWLYIILSVMFMVALINELNKLKEDKGIILIYIVLVLIIFIFGMIRIKNYEKAKKKANELLRNGILIKELSYDLLDDGLAQEDGSVDKVIAIKYKINDNHEITLKSEPLGFKFDNLKEKVDLLIDENDLLNFYIGFDIKEIKK